MDQCKGGIKNILVITDHCTKFSVAVATKKQMANTTIETLLHHFMYPYGIPSELLFGQGPYFESLLLGVEKVPRLFIILWVMVLLNSLMGV